MVKGRSWGCMLGFMVFSATYVMVVNDCWANDGWASVAAGGITFEKTNDISMKEEVLEISAKLIRVSYRFQNVSNKDVHATVAFPMPSYRFNYGFDASDINNHPLNSFVVKANGRNVPFMKDRRAKIGDKDITKQLQAIGLSDKQIFETFARCGDGENIGEYCGVTKEQENALKGIGEWSVFETAYWEQTFLANKEVAVLHEYEPLVGGTALPVFAMVDESGNACEDDVTQRAVQKQLDSLTASGSTDALVAISDVGYILWTGRTWSGPIGNFRLRIKKQSPKQIVSLCFPGKPKKIDSTTLEFIQENYTPQDKLLVRFFDVH